jgi:hypothetical protein
MSAENSVVTIFEDLGNLITTIIITIDRITKTRIKNHTDFLNNSVNLMKDVFHLFIAVSSR